MIINEAIAIEDNGPATNGVATMNLRLNHPSLIHLRWYFIITFQWYPKNASFTRKALCTAVQFLIVIFLCCCYAFDMGAFNNRSLIEEELGKTVTSAKNVIWSFRYLEMYILGVMYFRKRHLEKMLSEVILRRRHWEKIQRTIFKVSVAALLLVFVPVSSRVVQMSIKTRKVESFDLQQICLSVVLSILVRVVALPIFLAFIYVVYTTFSQVHLYKEKIQEWKDSKEKARNRFIDIANIIQDTERSFQSFLIAHLLLLLILLIPAIFSCAERLQAESHYKLTYVNLTEMTPAAAKNPPNPELLIVTNINHIQPQEAIFLFKLPADTNFTEPRALQNHTVFKIDVAGVAKIICSNLGDFLEMVMLYSLPLVFLAKLHKIITSLPEVVQKLKFIDQMEKGYLFQNEEVLKKMKRDLSTGRGVQILRMNLTGIKAALLTLLMPFLTTTIHLLFVHVDLS